MKKLVRTLAPVGLFVLVSQTRADAAPTMGTYLDARLSSETQGPNLKNLWSPLKADGWTSLPAAVVGVVSSGTSYPLCATANGSGWVGFGRPRAAGDKIVLSCETYASDSSTAYFFEFAAPKPAPMWLNTTASNPEPRGAIALVTQDSKRKIFACRFEKGGALYVGHIGDDGVCQGTTPSGTKDTATAYLTLVTKGTGPDAQPRWGWLDASPSYVPHKPTVFTASLNNGTAVDTRALCSVSDGGQTWPGWVASGGCWYFTYFNNATERKFSTTYKLVRVQPGAARAPWVFNRLGGKAYYACTSTQTTLGKVTDVMFGFTNVLGNCTDGTDSTNTENRPGRQWTGTKTIELPDADANAG